MKEVLIGKLEVKRHINTKNNTYESVQLNKYNLSNLLKGYNGLNVKITIEVET